MKAKPKSTIISYNSRTNNVIVFVESEIKYEIFNKNIDFQAIF